MPVPSKNTVASKRPDIQESMVEFDLEANNNKMVAERVFPTFEVGMAGGDYGRIKLEQLLEESDTSRASGASYGRGQYEFEEAFFQTKENGWEEPVDERDRNMYEDYFDAEIVAASRARSKILVNREKRCAKLSFENAAIVSTASANPWTNGAADPIDLVESAVIQVWRASGLWPDSMLMSYVLFRALRQVPQILDRISANGAGDKIKATDVNEQMLAQVFDLDELVVAGGSRNAAKKNLARDVQQIWDPTKCLIYKSIGSTDIREPGFGRTFHWGGDGSTREGLMESYWEESCRSDIQRCRQETDERVVYTEAAHLLTGLYVGPATA